MRLRHRIALQRRTAAIGRFGGEINEWEEVGTVFARVQVLKGRELLVAKQQKSEIVAVIRIRHRADVSGEWRCLHGGKVYIFDSVIDPDGRGHWLDIFATTAGELRE